jgi:peptidoglycan/LPS O-acetylase OafA/YrhL
MIIRETSQSILKERHDISKNIRLKYLDGVRGWAALSVLIFHSSWELFGRVLPRLRTISFPLLNNGPLAVYIFFVLSGFVLSVGYLRTNDLELVRKLALRRYI